MSPETYGLYEPPDTGPSIEFTAAYREQKATPILVNGWPRYLSHEAAMVAVQAPLYRRYAHCVAPMHFMAARQSRHDGMATINWRLVQLGYAATSLPAPDDDVIAPVEGEVEQPYFNQSTGRYDGQAPYEPQWSKDLRRDLATAATARQNGPNAPRKPDPGVNGRSHGAETQARAFSERHELPAHRPNRPSRTPVGRHLAYVKQRADALNVTAAVADSLLSHHPAGCEYELARQPKDPS